MLRRDASPRAHRVAHDIAEPDDLLMLRMWSRRARLHRASNWHAWASAITSLCLTRSVLVPEAVFLNTWTIWWPARWLDLANASGISAGVRTFEGIELVVGSFDREEDEFLSASKKGTKELR
jgi:hypothetical protein